jgi:hypothetical protein
MLFVHLLQMPGERATRFVRLLTLISFSVLVSSCGGGGIECTSAHSVA